LKPKIIIEDKISAKEKNKIKKQIDVDIDFKDKLDENIEEIR